MLNEIKDYIKKNKEFISFITFSFSVFGFAYFLRYASTSFGIDFIAFLIKNFDILILLTSVFLVMYNGFLSKSTYDIVNEVQWPSPSIALIVIYSIIISTIGFIVIKQEILYFMNYDKNVLISSLSYFDFYDKLFWNRDSFNINSTLIGAFLKIWIIGLFTTFNPFYAKNTYGFKINEKVFCFFFFTVFFISIYETLSVSPTDLMKSNYYFIKQMITFSILFLLMSNMSAIDNIKNLEVVLYNSQMLLFYSAIISLQTILYINFYNVYFMEVILIILALAFRDKFSIKPNKNFKYFLFSITFYELIFFVYNWNLVDLDKTYLEKTIAILISVCIYFYKETIVEFLAKFTKKFKNDADFEKKYFTHLFLKKFKTFIISDKIKRITFKREQKSFVFNINKHQKFIKYISINPFVKNYSIYLTADRDFDKDIEKSFGPVLINILNDAQLKDYFISGRLVTKSSGVLVIDLTKNIFTNHYQINDTRIERR